MFSLTWESYLIMAGVVFVAVTAAAFVFDAVDGRREKKKDPGPFPCMAHMGISPDGFHWWCFRTYGHEDDHMTQWGLNQTELDEWPDDDEVLATAAHNALADQSAFAQGAREAVEEIQVQRRHAATLPDDHNTFEKLNTSELRDQCPHEWTELLGPRCIRGEGHAGSHEYDS